VYISEDNIKSVLEEIVLKVKTRFKSTGFMKDRKSADQLINYKPTLLELVTRDHTHPYRSFPNRQRSD
jgi:hypothetical protein